MRKRCLWVWWADVWRTRLEREAYVWLCRWCNSLLKHPKTAGGCGARVCAACGVFAGLVFFCCCLVFSLVLFVCFVCGCCDLWFSSAPETGLKPLQRCDQQIWDWLILLFSHLEKAENQIPTWSFLYEAGFYRHAPNFETSDLFWDYTFTNERTRNLVDTL